MRSGHGSDPWETIGVLHRFTPAIKRDPVLSMVPVSVETVDASGKGATSIQGPSSASKMPELLRVDPMETTSLVTQLFILW